MFLSSGDDNDLSNGDKESLVFYLGHYLRFLCDANHHVLFDLPHFDNDKYLPQVDYSSAANGEDTSRFSLDSDVFGVRVSNINNYLRDLVSTNPRFYLTSFITFLHLVARLRFSSERGLRRGTCRSSFILHGRNHVV